MKVSAVVPARNEATSLATLIDSLLAQTLPLDEIVVADAGSTDGTAEIARRYTDRGVRVLEIGPAYPGRARNAGVVAARNEWIAFIDAGCVADARWLESLSGGLSESLVVFGNHEPVIRDEWDVAQALTIVGPCDRTGLRPPFIASSLVHRSVWEAQGGFAEDLRAAEDLIFFRRLEASGTPSARTADAVVAWSLSRGPVATFTRLRLYSGHHLAAGLASTWHARVVAMDLIGLACVIGAVWWLPLLAIPALAVTGRILGTMGRRRRNVPDGRVFRPMRILRVLLLLVLADCAVWLGMMDYALGRVRPCDSIRCT